MNLTISLPIDRWDPRRGGAERYLDRLCRTLCHRGHQVTVLCLKSAPVDDLAPGMRIQELAVPRWPRFFRELAFARRTVLAHRLSGRDLLYAVRHPLEADLYQPHGGSFRAAKQGAMAHLPRFCQRLRMLAGALRPTTRVLFWLDREVFVRSPEVMVVSLSAHVEAGFRRAYPQLKFHFRRLYNAVDTNALHDLDRRDCAAALRRRFAVRPERRIAVFLAHRFSSKGLKHAIRALAWAKDWHLVVGGRGRPSRFRRLGERCRVAPRVHFAGEVVDSRTVLAGADAFVLPTYHDACSLAVLESLACGTPVVTTRESGSAELMEGTGSGVVLEAPDHEEPLADALKRIATDWETFHQAALALRPSLDWETHVDHMEEILREVAVDKLARAAARAD